MNPMEWDPPVPNQTKDNIVFRPPRINDGAAIWRLVKESGVLDLNSSYMYLLLCKDFSDSCVVAEEDGQLLGFVTGYRPPGRENAIFLWQVGVDAKARGKGWESVWWKPSCITRAHAERHTWRPLSRRRTRRHEPYFAPSRVIWTPNARSRRVLARTSSPMAAMNRKNYSALAPTN